MFLKKAFVGFRRFGEIGFVLAWIWNWKVIFQTPLQLLYWKRTHDLKRSGNQSRANSIPDYKVVRVRRLGGTEKKTSTWVINDLDCVVYLEFDEKQPCPSPDASIWKRILEVACTRRLPSSILSTIHTYQSRSHVCEVKIILTNTIFIVRTNPTKLTQHSIAIHGANINYTYILNLRKLAL